jgi:hypothetical protein
MEAPPGDRFEIPKAEIPVLRGESVSKSARIFPSKMSLPEFRHHLEEIQDGWHRYVLTYIYMVAARANEACSLMSPSDAGPSEGKSSFKTLAIGPRKSDVEYDSYEGTELLTIRFGTLKRKDHPERIIALPLKSYDPWTDYLSRCFDKLEPTDSLVPFTRQVINSLYRRYGLNEPKKENGASRKNPLRHVRINHLIRYYHFEPFEITLYAGWDMGGSSQAFGGSATVSEYESQMWHLYFPKLLKNFNL